MSDDECCSRRCWSCLRCSCEVTIDEDGDCFVCGSIDIDEWEKEVDDGSRGRRDNKSP